MAKIIRRARRMSAARRRQMWVCLFETGRVVIRDHYVHGTVLVAIAAGDDVIFN